MPPAPERRSFRAVILALVSLLLLAAGVRLLTRGEAPSGRILVPAVSSASSAPAGGALSVGPDPSVAPAPGQAGDGSGRPHRQERYHPTGHLLVAEGGSEGRGSGTPVRFIVEVEEGIKVDPEAFAADVERVLLDRRSWPGTFQRVDHGSAAFRVTLASPELTDELCAPLQTAGIYSCYQGGRSVLNSMRWKRGADAYGNDLRGYRIYMINHEVGHALGYDHVECPGPGQKAPVMMQQTKGVEACLSNPWP